MVVGPMVPEAYEGAPIVLGKVDDSIRTDANKPLIQLNVSAKELARPKNSGKRPSLAIPPGVLAKYLVSTASRGAIATVKPATPLPPAGRRR
jgi:dihydroxyacid dehydratase/phosphogluconate dehydratase